MKSAPRMLIVILSVMTMVVALSLPTLAESRGKALKRAEKEIRAANFIEAEKIYRQLLEKDQADKDARLGLSFALIKQLKLQDSYEQAAQVIGGHSQCAGCHEPHSGQRRPDKPCASCHADRASAGHGKRVDCTSCHRAHGPKGPAKPPACDTCHPADKRPGLHRVAQHATCNGCHAAHEQHPADDRATCVRCHQAQINHEPTATRCGTCHPFGRGVGVVIPAKPK